MSGPHAEPFVPEVFKRKSNTLEDQKEPDQNTSGYCPVKEYLRTYKTKPPRCDSSSYYFHGKIFPDPFRPLEAFSEFIEDQDSDLYQWIKYQKSLLQEYIGLRDDRSSILAAIKKSFRSAYSGLSGVTGDFSPVRGHALTRPSISETSRKRDTKIRVGSFIFSISPVDPDKHCLVKECLLTKKKTVLFDEKDFNSEQTLVKIKRVCIHPRGKTALIYFFAQNNVFFQPESKFCLRLVDTISGETLEETDKATYDFSFEAWHPIAGSYYYTRSNKSPYLKDLYVHERGALFENDPVVVENFSSEDSSLETYWRFEETALSGRALALNKYSRQMSIPIRQYLTDIHSAQRLINIPAYLTHNYGEFFGLDDAYLYVQKSIDFRKKQILKFSLNNYTPGDKQIVIPSIEIADSSNPIFIHNLIVVIEASRLEHVLRAYDPEGRQVFEYKPNIPSSLEIVSVNYEELSLDIRINNYLHPHELVRVNVKDFRPSTLLKGKSPKGAQNIVLSREMALSSDGTSVPITLIHHKNTAMDGTAPTILWGYGGFGLCGIPEYDPFVSCWVQRGGIYAIAHVRGDGGWEPGWAEAGSGRMKPNTFNDFISCAEHLINSGKTSPRKLVAMGGSNGGLTVVASMQKRPDLFACVVSLIPVLDMMNVCIGLDYYVSTMWSKDFGSPMVPEDLEVISGYSPLQNVDKNTKYPPCLVMTAGEDTTAHPAHSLKFIATMQDLSPQSPCLLFWKDKGGHSDLFRDEAGDTDYDAYAVMMKFIEAALKQE